MEKDKKIRMKETINFREAVKKYVYDDLNLYDKVYNKAFCALIDKKCTKDIYMSEHSKLIKQLTKKINIIRSKQ